VTAATAGAAGVPLRIGEVLAVLRREFPDVSISKLRFLEAEGLVEPLRTAAGYRKYSPHHVARLRFILAAQRDRYLPLRVIRDQLARLDRGEPVLGLAPPDRVTPPVSQPAPDCEAAADGLARASAADRVARAAPVAPAGGSMLSELPETRLTLAELARRADLEPRVLTELEQYGLINVDASGRVDVEVLAVARLVGRLLEYGLQPRHLRPYRAAADRDVGLLTQLVAPLARRREPVGRAEAAQLGAELATVCGQLHAALVRTGLRGQLG
jgi:DNA-binding transcriptional MerR regulator